MDEPATCPLPPEKEGWTALERGELALIGFLLPALYLLAREGLSGAWNPRFGALLSYSAALVLGQGLIRDLVRLAIQGRQEPTRRMACLCAESTLGLTVLVAGAGLLLLGIEDRVSLGAGGITALVAAILVCGFVAKDYVLVIRKERDHGSVLVG